MPRNAKKETVKKLDDQTPAVLSDKEKQIMARGREKIIAGQVPFKKGFPAAMEGKSEALSSAILMETSQSNDYLGALQIVKSAAAGHFWKNETDANLSMALSQMSALEPQTPLEAMLVSQMVAVNTAIGKVMSRAMHHEQTMAGRELNTNLATKLQRTFLQQIDALHKLRGKGQQTVRVEHVTVNAGGQAIVGNVEHRAEGGEGRNGK